MRSVGRPTPLPVPTYFFFEEVEVEEELLEEVEVAISMSASASRCWIGAGVALLEEPAGGMENVLVPITTVDPYNERRRSQGEGGPLGCLTKPF